MREIIRQSGYAFGFGMTLVVCIIFYTAYSSPDKLVMVTIDSIGEANIEFFLMPIIMSVILLGWYYDLKHYNVKIKRKE